MFTIWLYIGMFIYLYKIYIQKSTKIYAWCAENIQDIKIFKILNFFNEEFLYIKFVLYHYIIYISCKFFFLHKYLWFINYMSNKMKLDVIIEIGQILWLWEQRENFKSILKRNFLAAKDNENCFIKITSHC